MALKKNKAQKNVDLSLLSTWGIGGKAKNFFLVPGVFDLFNLAAKLKNHFYLLGNGSNLLIKNGLIKKPVIQLCGDFTTIQKRQGRVEAGPAVLLSDLVAYCAERNLTGLEKLAGMPATIGGMLAVNASSFGVTIFDCLEEVEVIDSRKNLIIRLEKDEIKRSYRYSGLKGKIITKAYFRFPKGENIKRKVQSAIRKRLKMQDFSLPSCGCVFKNPSIGPAAELIEKAGMKGKVRGGLKVSKKHANFIINWGKGSYRDADYLIKEIKDSVYRKEKIILEEEIERWG